MLRFWVAFAAPLIAERRGVIATHTVATQPGPKVAKSLCGWCLVKLSKQMSCGKCMKVDYCSVEHQYADWKAGHKKECKILNSSNNTQELAICVNPELDREGEWAKGPCQLPRRGAVQIQASTHSPSLGGVFEGQERCLHVRYYPRANFFQARLRRLLSEDCDFNQLILLRSMLLAARSNKAQVRSTCRQQEMDNKQWLDATFYVVFLPAGMARTFGDEVTEAQLGRWYVGP